MIKLKTDYSVYRFLYFYIRHSMFQVYCIRHIPKSATKMNVDQ